MTKRRTRSNRGVGRMIALSFVMHLALYFFLYRFHFTDLYLKEAPTYYVDLTSLPVASPQAGTGDEGGKSPPQQATPPPASPPQQMTAPKAVAAEKITPARPAGTAAGGKNAEPAREFNERLAKMAREVEERRQAAAIEELRKKVAGKGGVPGGMGSEAGSDYANYVQSRLRDALSVTIAYQTKNPQVVLRITIDRNGRVVRSVIERSTRDQVFEQAVAMAVAIAEKTFPPPPGGGEFERGFIFRPQGVGKQ